MKLRLNAVAFAAAALVLGQGAVAGEAEAKKWVDSEFQPSTLSKDQQMAEMKCSSTRPRSCRPRA